MQARSKYNIPMYIHFEWGNINIIFLCLYTKRTFLFWPFLLVFIMFYSILYKKIFFGFKRPRPISYPDILDGWFHYTKINNLNSLHSKRRLRN